MELEVTVVHRDKMWFQSYLPLMQKFISDLEKYREEYKIYGDSLFEEEKKKPSPKKRKINEVACCMIQDFD